MKNNSQIDVKGSTRSMVKYEFLIHVEKVMYDYDERFFGLYGSFLCSALHLDLKLNFIKYK